MAMLSGEMWLNRCLKRFCLVEQLCTCISFMMTSWDIPHGVSILCFRSLVSLSCTNKNRLGGKDLYTFPLRAIYDCRLEAFSHGVLRVSISALNNILCINRLYFYTALKSPVSLLCKSQNMRLISRSLFSAKHTHKYTHQGLSLHLRQG